MKKKILIGVGILFSLLLVAVISAVIYFWPYISAVDWSLVNAGNIRALYVGLTEDPEVTKEKKKDNDRKRSEEIRNYLSSEIRDFTEDELRQIESGEKSETEILAQIITESVQATESEESVEITTPDTTIQQGDNNAPQTEDTPQKPVETADSIIARHVSQLYSVQSEFEGRVANLAASASNWVKAYKKANPGITWRDAKVAGVQYFSGTASQIEQECYAKVDSQMAILKADLEAIGADTSIVATIKDSAYAEMDARKAQIVQEGKAKLNKND